MQSVIVSDRRWLRLAGTFMLTICGLIQHAAWSQSLNSQYANYLGGKCENLHFQRDAAGNLLPGQAGPQLLAYCNGPPIVGGNITESATGGGASAEEDRTSTDDSVLRRRRAAARAAAAADSTEADDTVQTKSGPDDFSILSSGNFSVFDGLRYARERQSVTEYEDGRHDDRWGMLGGADYRFGSKGLAGVAIKGEELHGTFDAGGHFESNSVGGLIYGSWYPAASLFVDATLGFDRLKLNTERVVSLTRTVSGFGGGSSSVEDIPAALASSEPGGRAFTAEIRSGYDLIGAGMTFGPRFALSRRQTNLDGYVESGVTPMTLAVDPQTEVSLQSSLGFQLSRAFAPSGAVVVPQLNLDWLHEFEDRQRTITARFAQDLRPDPVKFSFLTDAPDRDVFVGRLGAATVFRGGLSGFVSIDHLFGHTYISRDGVSLGFRKEL